MSLLQNIFRNFGMVFFSDLVGRVLFFFLIWYIARFLGAEGVGYYSFVFAFVGLFVVFNDVGLSILYVREVSRRRELASSYLSSILTLKLILGIATFAASALTIILVEDRFFIIAAVLFASVAMFFSSMKDSFITVFQSFEQMNFIAGIRAFESLFIVGFSVLALFAGYDVVAIALIFLLGYALTASVSAIAVRRLAAWSLSADWRLWKSFLMKSAPFWLTGVFLAIYFRIDTVMLGIMRTYAETGVYNAAYRLLDALYIVPGALIPVLYPVMSRMHQKEKGMLTEIYHRAFSYLLFIALPMAVGATFLAHRIMSFIYGGDFSTDAYSAAFALQILIWAELFIFLSSISGHMLNAIDRQNIFTFTAVHSSSASIFLLASSMTAKA